jgi:hypothetical protein
MIDYSKTQETFKALRLQFSKKSKQDVLFAMKKYNSERLICDYLGDIIPF